MDIIRFHSETNLKAQSAHEVTLTDRAARPIMDSNSRVLFASRLRRVL
jgi:hypothetical protein